MENREFETLMKRMDSQDRDLREIKDHVQKTNGRVSLLEKWQSYLDGRNAAVGEQQSGLRSWHVALVASLVSGVVGGVFVLVAQLAH